MKGPAYLVVFRLDDNRFALHLSAVARVIRVVEAVPLPEAPDIVTGVINIQGKIVPVVNIRKRFRIEERTVDLNDHMIIAVTSKREVGIIVDEVLGVIECPEERIVMSGDVLSGMEYIEGMAKLEDGMVLIHDIEKFLSLEEEIKLDKAIGEM